MAHLFDYRKIFGLGGGWRLEWTPDLCGEFSLDSPWATPFRFDLEKPPSLSEFPQMYYTPPGEQSTRWVRDALFILHPDDFQSLSRIVDRTNPAGQSYKDRWVEQLLEMDAKMVKGQGAALYDDGPVYRFLHLETPYRETGRRDLGVYRISPGTGILVAGPNLRLGRREARLLARIHVRDRDGTTVTGMVHDDQWQFTVGGNPRWDDIFLPVLKERGIPRLLVFGLDPLDSKPELILICKKEPGIGEGIESIEIPEVDQENGGYLYRQYFLVRDTDESGREWNVLYDSDDIECLSYRVEKVSPGRGRSGKAASSGRSATAPPQPKARNHRLGPDTGTEAGGVSGKPTPATPTAGGADRGRTTGSWNYSVELTPGTPIARSVPIECLAPGSGRLRQAEGLLPRNPYSRDYVVMLDSSLHPTGDEDNTAIRIRGCSGEEGRFRVEPVTELWVDHEGQTVTGGVVVPPDGIGFMGPRGTLLEIFPLQEAMRKRGYLYGYSIGSMLLKVEQDVTLIGRQVDVCDLRLPGSSADGALQDYVRLGTSNIHAALVRLEGVYRLLNLSARFPLFIVRDSGILEMGPFSAFEWTGVGRNEFLSPKDLDELKMVADSVRSAISTRPEHVAESGEILQEGDRIAIGIAMFSWLPPEI